MSKRIFDKKNIYPFLILTGMYFQLFYIQVSAQTITNKWYVDKNATGLKNGTSWLNGWTSFSAINWSSIKPGDIIFISGGTDSVLYNENLIIGISGNQSGRITISKSYESGHNGRVIFKPITGNGILVNNKSYINVHGFEIENPLTNSSNNVEIDNCSYITVDSMYLRPNSRGVFIQECESGIEISRNKIITVTYSTNQTDCIYSQRNREIKVWGNYLEVRNSEPNGHNDCFQSFQDGKDATNSNKNTVTFYNNTLYQNNIKQSNSSGTMPTYGWGWFTYYNNLVIQPYSYVMGLGVQQNSDGSTNMKARIWNNTFIAGSVQDKSIYFRYMKNIDTIDVANNIIFSSYKYGSAKIDDSPNLTIKRWDNNIYYSTNSQWTRAIVNFNGSWKSLLEWKAMGHDINGFDQNPSLVNPVIGLNGIGDYKNTGNSITINNGISILPYFNFDQIGTPRPQGNAWDIGAYEYTDGSVVTDNTSPNLLTATVINPTTIELGFSEALESASALNKLNYTINNGIVVNSVSLSTDSKKVTLNTTTNAANQTYTVVVSNVKDLAGNVISASNSAQYSYAGDTTPPNLLSAAVINPTTIELTFSEALENSSALLKSNYSINNGTVVNSVSLSTDSKKVTLFTTTNSANQTYTVTVSNIKDLAGNIISVNNNSAQYSYVGDTTPPNLLSAAVINPTTIELTFSEALENSSALVKTNYLINNGIVVNSVVLSTDKKSVTLATSQHIISQNYIVTVSNVKDLAGNSIAPSSSVQYSFINNTVGNLKANVKIFLQGPYQNNNMTSELSGNELLPNAQPYNKLPWLYNGTEVLGSGASSSTDWVLVELRSAQNPVQVISRRACLLRNDGRIIEPNGNLGVTFNNLLYGSYYIAVFHRNHLAVMTAVPVLFSPDNSLYDFTNALTKAYGQSAMTEMTTGIFGMYAGDGNGDGIVDDKDRNEVWSNQNGNLGYYNGDFNLDSGVTVKDINDYWNLNSGKRTQVP